jgi:class 3 adenylate cyclase
MAPSTQERPPTRIAHDSRVRNPLSDGSGSDYHIAYQVFGEGPTDIVFCPEWFNNIDMWWDEPRVVRFLDRLASFSRVIVFDKRGTGISDPVPLDRDPVLETWMDDVARVMDYAGSKEATLFGHSGGGQICLLFAATYPERTRSLVLSNSWARLADAPDYWGTYESMKQWHPDRIARVLMGMASETWEYYRDAGFDLGAPPDDAFRAWYGRYGRASMAYGPAATLNVRLHELDVSAILPTITAPALVLSKRDHFLGTRPGRALADALPNAKYVELPGSDHLFFFGDTLATLDEVELFVTGELRNVESDRALATLMFTDIVSSTEQAAALGDRRWNEVLQAHDELIDRAILGFGGRRVKHTGDGVLATFDGPGRAVRCAQAIARGVRALGIEVRAGLHTGEIQWRGDDVAGLAVNIAKRVNDIAGPSEILVSSTVRDIVIGSQLSFDDRGTHDLKGVPEPWHIYSVDPSLIDQP